jgi:hypothetical protein
MAITQSNRCKLFQSIRDNNGNPHGRISNPFSVRGFSYGPAREKVV